MKIQNRNLANETLRMRSGISAKGDAEGIFECSEEDARILLQTPGWGSVGSKTARGGVSGADLNEKYTKKAVRRAEDAEEASTPPTPAPNTYQGYAFPQKAAPYWDCSHGSPS